MEWKVEVEVRVEVRVELPEQLLVQPVHRSPSPAPAWLHVTVQD